MDTHETKITGITITGYVQPWNCDNRDQAAITVLQANGSDITVQVGEKVYSTNDEGYQNSGSDPVAMALNQVMAHVLGNHYSGYLHNYDYRDGYAYEAEDGAIDG